MNKLTEENIKIHTFWSKRLYKIQTKNILNYELDIYQDNRLKYRECKTCYYLKHDRIVTQAFTDYECLNCGTRHTHHNGGVPRYCTSCSTSFGICVRCGAELVST